MSSPYTVPICAAVALCGIAAAMLLLLQPDLARRAAFRGAVAVLLLVAAVFVYGLGREVDRLADDRAAAEQTLDRVSEQLAAERELAEKQKEAVAGVVAGGTAP